MTTYVQTSVVPQTASKTTSHPSSATQRRLTRAIGLGAPVAGASAVWGVADALGANFRLTDSQSSVVIGLPTVIGFTLFCAALGWGALAVLERFTRRAARTWTRLAVAVLALSIVPIFLEHATAGTRAALVAIHLAVAAVLIPVLRRSAKRA